MFRIPTLMSLMLVATYGFAVEGPAPQCMLCTSALSEIKAVVSDKETQAIVNFTVQEICEILPIENCATFIQERISGFETTVSKMDPNQVCHELGMCPKTFGRVRGMPEVACQVCKFVGDEFEKMVLTEANKDAVVHFIAEEACSKVPFFKKKCADIASSYGRRIVDQLVESFDVENVCGMAHLCHPKLNEIFPLLQAVYESFGNEDGCKACKAGFGDIKLLLSSKFTRELVHIAINETCMAAATKPTLDMCESVATAIVDEVVDNMLALFDVGAICKSIGTCPATELTSLQNEDGCKACMDGLDIVDKILKSSELKDLINIAVNETCMAIGVGVDTCEQVTESIVDQIVSNLVAMFNPKALCQYSGACPKLLGETAESPVCTVCKDGFTLIERTVFSDELKDMIHVGVKVTCNSIGLTGETCEHLVNTIIDQISGHLKPLLNPDMICSKVGACSAHFALNVPEVGNKDGCRACIDGLEIVKAIIDSPATLDLVDIAIDETCTAIGSNVETCKQILSGIITPIIKNLLPLFDPKSLCHQAGACPNNLLLANLQSDSAGCEACKDGFHVIEQIMNSAEFMDLINLGVKEICMTFGGNVGVCDKILMSLINPVVKNLLPLFNADRICGAMSVCNTTLLSTNSSPKCQACSDGLTLIKGLLVSNELRDMAHIAINTTCSAIGGPGVKQCVMIFTIIVDNIQSQLAPLFDPVELCSIAGACPKVTLNSITGRKYKYCDACTEAFDLGITSFLNSADVIDFIKSVADEACSYESIPSCTDVVKSLYVYIKMCAPDVGQAACSFLAFCQ